MSGRGQSRKIAIFGFAEVALGQTIQHFLVNFKPTSNGLTSRPFCDGTSAALIAGQDIRQFSNAWCRENYDRQHELLWSQVPREHRFKHSVVDDWQDDDLVHSGNTRKRCRNRRIVFQIFANCRHAGCPGAAD